MGKEIFDKYLQYILNASGGRGKILAEYFDEDWEPIGPKLRREMAKHGLIKEEGRYICLLVNPSSN